MLKITVIICSLGNQLFPFEVPGEVIVGNEWIEAPALALRFDRKQCWIETADVEENHAVQ
jgi:hypothetical protein